MFSYLVGLGWLLFSQHNIHEKVVFQFGDSLSDTGNSLLGLGITTDASPPYGMTFFGHPTGRVCNGRLVIDFIATKLGIPLLDPYCKVEGANTLHGVNFATNGATALGYEFYSERNMSMGLERTYPLDVQLDMFLRFRQAQYKDLVLPPSAIYMVGEIGGNDYKTMIENKLTASEMHSLVPIVVGSIEQHIKALYEAGARRFIVVNIPLQGCNPRWRARASPSDETDEFGCLVWLNKINHHHNSLLKSMAQRLGRELDGASVSYADLAGVFSQVLDDPGAHGFWSPLVACCGIYTNTTTVTCNLAACCKDPSRFVFWNDNHFTEQFNSVVASSFMSPSAAFMHPPFDWWSSHVYEPLEKQQ